jgi:methanol--5-hydroxybenzimidazolylcobamide Co-methyltransferase
VVKFAEPAFTDAADLIYGTAPRPLETRSGMVIGGGTVYPELNFTLPTMQLNAETFPRARRHYEQIVSEALKRAAELQSPGVVLEFEALPPMTENPDWAVEITQVLLDGIAAAKDQYGLRAALRVTPNDNREMVRPPLMREGQYWDAMLETFDRCAALGADLLSIESVGGKEVHDDALTMCDIGGVIFALCIMGVRDMRWLWDHIVEIAARHGSFPAGDTACGFGNTAMVLAEQRMIPRVFAAVVRPITAVRSLVAYECGAVGPGKDCGYENVILKALTGLPMSMEGKTAACAHLSPVGNVAAAACDLWSNESVQNLRLLGAMAPVCYMEQLIYDCRLFNRAAQDGPAAARQLRDWMVEPDAALDPQAVVLTPESAVAFARTIAEAGSPYDAGRAVALQAVQMLREAREQGALEIADRDARYLDIIEDGVTSLPDGEDAFITQMMSQVDTSRFRPEDYGL